ncbi:hypothetical protein EVB94_272 [Rhizobium phage RHph_TM40]|uniref:Uncharacterized protein n=2 Tax=Cuauhnahuacvirus TaxID=3044696 RepID=A0A7S5R830_9CAUD|nr:hypothetical protein PQC16_gp272 [Rhizobium phage RHph_TM30]YP_010671421.1 hypothetical protein PQC17_gp272 [Rhizobium phage RHph_Y65]QIG71743.1 hypothetical protein EVB94_272 [Rhizobium phage RHph_TM40]QIG72105.1 hypothetical protein EVB95_271 [Rhizobium phage RHph_TM2_3B]QIG72467.1 hypothetical protein EVB96_271 [Rhizobium phage RHph_TM3_3_6]QIG71379.1 hypothetical protein EVB93_272 [Rhizobium phage RHph_TM30]QIG72830.1 hypothetical protein EVB97_272 [Rhizobium phage RHph_Y65]
MTESDIFSKFRQGRNDIDRDACLHMLLANCWNRNSLVSVEFPVRPNINLCVDFVISPSLRSIDVKRKEYKSFIGGNETLSTSLDLAKDALEKLEEVFYASMFGAH